MDHALAAELTQEYRLRFAGMAEYRDRIWKTLNSCFFQRYIPPSAAVLDLGSGWGEFINNIEAPTKYAMDLNPDGGARVKSEVRFINQDCSEPWDLPDDSLDVVFTSNFFEHLPTKAALSETIEQAHRCLKPGGRIICLGPNLRYLPGEYWDFWDHHVALTDMSLVELLRLRGFEIDQQIDRFLPFTMVNRRPSPLFLVRMYLRMPFVWPIFGKQFLVVARTKK